jgi:hypothetical protein
MFAGTHIPRRMSPLDATSGTVINDFFRRLAKMFVAILNTRTYD